MGESGRVREVSVGVEWESERGECWGSEGM